MNINKTILFHGALQEESTLDIMLCFSSLQIAGLQGHSDLEQIKESLFYYQKSLANLNARLLGPRTRLSDVNVFIIIGILSTRSELTAVCTTN
jgi:hypothetical protein